MNRSTTISQLLRWFKDSILDRIGNSVPFSSRAFLRVNPNFILGSNGVVGAKVLINTGLAIDLLPTDLIEDGKIDLALGPASAKSSEQVLDLLVNAAADLTKVEKMIEDTLDLVPEFLVSPATLSEALALAQIMGEQAIGFRKLPDGKVLIAMTNARLIAASLSYPSNGSQGDQPTS